MKTAFNSEERGEDRKPLHTDTTANGKSSLPLSTCGRVSLNVDGVRRG